MANFDIIEYQKRVINDLSAENKALKEQMRGMCHFCEHHALSNNEYPCSECFKVSSDSELSHWKWKGVDGK